MMILAAHLMAMPVTATFDVKVTKKTSLMSRVWKSIRNARQSEANEVVKGKLHRI
ncbi:hypothetical protein SAMN04515695_4920 [Pseudovibrio sp. Tun.PSC04-5.I4]|nr:hypothetical protein SAMN04515695_4920 [Pseudovibrio sp. Tun.PSC04-5.I4]